MLAKKKLHSKKVHRAAIGRKKIISYILPQSMVWVLISLLSACASHTGPVIIRDSGTASTAPTETAQPSRPDVRPVAPAKAAPSSVSPLKQKLIRQSEQALVKDNPKGAIVLAERGLRIDRKEPQFYQVLASAYDALSNQAQSIYFAKQGLRYAKKGSEVYQSLEKWLP